LTGQYGEWIDGELAFWVKRVPCTIVDVAASGLSDELIRLAF